MTNKKHDLVIDKQENIDRLVATVIKIMDELQIQMIPTGGVRGGKLRPDIDFSGCEFRDTSQRKLGEFEYTRVNGHYSVLLNLESVPEDKYKIIMGIISNRFSRYLNTA